MAYVIHYQLEQGAAAEIFFQKTYCSYVSSTENLGMFSMTANQFKISKPHALRLSAPQRLFIGSPPYSAVSSF